MKKVLSMILALVLVVSSFSFASVDYNQVGQELKGLGVIKGDASGNLFPENNLTREQAVVTLARLMGVESAAAATKTMPSFNDVPKGNYYAPYIAYAELKGWTKGMGGGRFGLGLNVTTQQYVTYMLRALGYGSTPYSQSMAKAAQLGLLKDVKASGGDDVIKRGDVFVIMRNTLYTKPMGKAEDLVYVLGLKKQPKPVVTNLVLEGVSADNLKEVKLSFNNPINTASLNKDNFKINNNAAKKVMLEDGGKNVIAYFDGLTNQKEYEIKVIKITDTKSQTLSNITKKFTVRDFSAPTVESVVAVGNKSVVITFSEPIDSSTANVLGNFKLDNRLFGGSLTVDGRKVSIVFSNRMSNGTHNLTIKDGIKDFAGFKVTETTKSFTVGSDTSAPTIESVVSASQTKVVIKFSEPVDSNFGVSVGSGSYSKKSSNDNQTYTFEFLLSNPIPLSGTEFTFTNVTDFSGNKATLKTTVKPKLDLVRPEVVGITQEASNKLVVEFSKDVNTNGTYVLKTTGSNPTTVGHSTLAYYVKDGKTNYNKILLTFSNHLDSKSYNLEVSGVTDKTPLANVMVPVSRTITIADKTNPTVVNLKVKQPTSTQEGAIYAEFSEAVNASSALVASNYTYVLNGTKPVSVDGTFAITVLADQKTVKITVPKTSDGPITNVTITNVTDVAGNRMIPYVTSSITAIPGSTISISNPKAIALNKVSLDVVGTIDATTVTTYDYAIVNAVGGSSAGVSVTSATYNQDHNRIELLLSDNLTHDAKYNNNQLNVKIIANNLSDIYGNKLASSQINTVVSGGPIKDGIAPEAISLVSAESNATMITIKIKISEAAYVNSFNQANYVLVVDGNRVNLNGVSFVAENTANNTPNHLVFTASAADMSGKNFTLNYYKSNDLLDNIITRNQLPNFAFSGTLQ